MGSLAQLRQVVDAYEAVNKEFDITKLRWMVHHVPNVDADLLNRLKARPGILRVKALSLPARNV